MGKNVPAAANNDEDIPVPIKIKKPVGLRLIKVLNHIDLNAYPRLDSSLSTEEVASYQALNLYSHITGLFNTTQSDMPEGQKLLPISDNWLTVKGFFKVHSDGTTQLLKAKALTEFWILWKWIAGFCQTSALYHESFESLYN